MNIELTPQQSDQLVAASDTLVVHDPRSDRRYVLVPQEEYSRWHDGVRNEDLATEGELLEDLDPETLAAIEEGWAQSERGEGVPIEVVREMFRLKQETK